MSQEPDDTTEGHGVEVINAQQEIVEIVARSRLEGWYEDHPGWDRVDELLSLLGLPNGSELNVT